MAIELHLAQASNGKPVLSVKSFNAGEAFNAACRIGRWLQHHCKLRAYNAPAAKDKVVEGMYYSPVPLSYGGVTVSPLGIRDLLAAMDEKDFPYEFTATFLPYLWEEEEVNDLVCPFHGVDLDGMTKAQLRKLADEHGVRIGSKFTKAQMVESLQDHLVAVPLS